MNQKLNYVTPETELILIRFEKNILSEEPADKPYSFGETVDVQDRSRENWW